jgi:hypothetical protein
VHIHAARALSHLIRSRTEGAQAHTSVQLQPPAGRSISISLLDGVELVRGEGLALHAAELEGGEPLRHVLIGGGRLLKADVCVDPGAGESADDGSEEVEPEARVDVAGHRRRQRPRRVHRSAGHRPENITRRVARD